MNPIRNLLFEMLLAAVAATDARERFSSRAFSDEELKVLYSLAKAHDMAHLVGFALQKNKSALASESGKALSKAYLLSVFRREKMDHEFGRICRVLDEEGIDYLPLKGAVIRLFYPEPWMRTSSDIDVLVHKEDLEKALEAIKARLSYREEGPRLLHDVQLYSPGGIHLELHFSVLEGEPEMDEVLSLVWDHTEPDAGRRRRLREPFFYFYHLAHAARHFLDGGCGIRPFMDLFLMRQKLPVEEKELRLLLKKAKLETFYEACLELTGHWFEGEPESFLTREMEAYLLGGGVFGSIENRVAMNRSNEQSKTAYFFRRVFMPMSSLKRYYPALAKHPVLYPYYLVKRWLRVSFGKNRSNAWKELKRNATLSQSKEERVRALRSSLGLEENKK